MNNVLKWQRISLTDFIAFINKQGVKKLQQIEQMALRDKYEPQKDFYRKCRLKIIEFAKSGSFNPSNDAIKEFLSSVNPNRVKHYYSLLKGYKKLLSNKQVEWVEPPVGMWTANELSVKLNPEIGLTIDKKHTAIKLYLKDEKLTQESANIILTIMDDVFSRDGFKSAILDVRRGKLFYLKGNRKLYKVFAESEAELFFRLFKAAA
jgi:hypothetical protein